MSDSSEETELPQAEKPDNFEERVVSGNERTTRQDIVRLKALLKKAFRLSIFRAFNHQTNQNMHLVFDLRVRICTR